MKTSILMDPPSSHLVVTAALVGHPEGPRAAGAELMISGYYTCLVFISLGEETLRNTNNPFTKVITDLWRNIAILLKTVGAG